MAAILKKIFPILEFSSRKFRFSLRSSCSTSVQNVHTCSVITDLSYKVNNFGNLRVFSENIGLHVTASNSWNGDQNTVVISLVSNSEDASTFKEALKDLKECIRCNVVAKGDELSDVMIQTDTKKILQHFHSTLLDSSKLLIEIPHSYNLFVKSSSTSPVTVEKLEADKIELQVDGDCYLSNLKSQLITVDSVSGDIRGKSSLIGDVALKTNQNGCVLLGKIQGNNVKIGCENGDVKIASLYSGKVLINTSLGNVDIGDAHGNTEIFSKSGDVKCASVSGLLQAVTDDGDIDAKLTSGGNVIATSLNGNATIKLDQNLKCELELSSKTMNVSSDIHITGKSQRTTDGLITLTGQTPGKDEHYAKVNCCNGNIDLLQESWFVLPEI